MLGRISSLKEAVRHSLPSVESPSLEGFKKYVDGDMV